MFCTQVSSVELCFCGSCRMYFFQKSGAPSKLEKTFGSDSDNVTSTSSSTNRPLVHQGKLLASTPKEQRRSLCGSFQRIRGPIWTPLNRRDLVMRTPTICGNSHVGLGDLQPPMGGWRSDSWKVCSLVMRWLRGKFEFRVVER